MTRSPRLTTRLGTPFTRSSALRRGAELAVPGHRRAERSSRSTSSSSYAPRSTAFRDSIGSSFTPRQAFVADTAADDSGQPALRSGEAPRSGRLRLCGLASWPRTEADWDRAASGQGSVVLVLDGTWMWATAAQLRSGFVPETLAKSVEFAGIRSPFLEPS